MQEGRIWVNERLSIRDLLVFETQRAFFVSKFNFLLLQTRNSSHCFQFILKIILPRILSFPCTMQFKRGLVKQGQVPKHVLGYLNRINKFINYIYSSQKYFHGKMTIRYQILWAFQTSNYQSTHKLNFVNQSMSWAICFILESFLE